MHPRDRSVAWVGDLDLYDFIQAHRANVASNSPPITDPLMVTTRLIRNRFGVLIETIAFDWDSWCSVMVGKSLI
jgi:hypothetical protein